MTLEMGGGDVMAQRKLRLMPDIWTTPQATPHTTVGKPERKVDAVKLVQGKPAFTDDLEMRGMLVAKVLHSPLAHARILKIDASKARALPGVAAVLTWQIFRAWSIPTAGQSDPIPGPLDAFSLDQKVRFVGDRVAFVAAESEEIAEQALKLIEVDYEPLPAVIEFDPIDESGRPSFTMNRSSCRLATATQHATSRRKSALISAVLRKALKKRTRDRRRL